MHKGRPYPYLHEYWATNWLYWPNYAPRRLILVPFATTGTDWDVLNNFPNALSDVGAYDLSAGRLVYDFTLPGTGTIRVSYFDGLYPATDALNRFHFEYTGVGTADMERSLPYDSAVDFGIANWFIEVGTTGTFVGVGTGNIVTVLVSPATWADGGGT